MTEYMTTRLEDLSLNLKNKLSGSVSIEGLTMSRFRLFIVLYSIVLLALFAAMCYLMSTVDPKPKMPPQVVKGSAIEPIDSEDLFPPAEARPSVFDYGLQKGEEIPNTTTTTSKLISFYRELSRRGALVHDPKVVDVVPPTMPSLLNASSANETMFIVTLDD